MNSEPRHPTSGSPEIGHSKMRKPGKPDLHPISGLPEIGRSEMRKPGKPDLRPISGLPEIGHSEMRKPGKPDLRLERVAKVIARAGLASRREAEAWITAGRVAVNGKPIGSPACNVTALDRIAVDGKPLPARERTRLFLYHKPRGLVTSHVDPAGRPTIFNALPAHLPRLISVGRLDLNTEGLLLLTNDGGLARALELPSTGWLRRYRVRAHGTVRPERLETLRQGITIDGIRYGAIEASLDRSQGSNLWLTFAIREGKNREVKNVLGHLGLAVNRLIRVSFGPFQLGDLVEGAIEEVRTRTLREQLGERIAALAGADFSGPRIEHGSERAELPDRPPEARTMRQERAIGMVPRRQRASQETKERKHAPHRVGGKQRRHDAERIGEPERARREKRRRRRHYQPS
jgi:23S rRNA pseudouridine2605 synthase